MKNSRNIKEIIDNNVITKSERMPVGASIARPHTRRLKPNQAGITLIALIITIIILLILASITINLTLGERGIFNTAQKAGQNYKDAEEKELADLTNFEEEAENIINEIEKGNIITTKPENIEGKIGISFTGVTTTSSLPVTIKAKISNIENSDENLSNAKWVLNDNPNKIGTESTLYTGSFTEENETEIAINEAKEYYVHVLSTDNSGKTTETISKAVKVEGKLHTHTGDATNGGGCYGEGVPIYHQHSDGCYGTCTGLMSPETYEREIYCRYTCGTCRRVVWIYKKAYGNGLVACKLYTVCGLNERYIRGIFWMENKLRKRRRSNSR